METKGELSPKSSRAFKFPFSLNYRIHPLATLIASAQMKSLNRRLAQRRLYAQQLSKALTNLPGIQPVFVAADCESAFYRYSPTYIYEEWDGLSRATVVEALAAEGAPICEGFIRTLLPQHLASHRQPVGWYPSLSSCSVAKERCALRQLEIGNPTTWQSDLMELFEQISIAVCKVYKQRHYLKLKGKGIGRSFR